MTQAIFLWKTYNQKKDGQMTDEQFKELMERLSKISDAINYVGNTLEDHARHSSNDLSNIAKAIDEN